MSSTTLAFAALIGASAYFLSLRYRQAKVPYPPGPPPKPLIGNILDFPIQKPWVQFMNMSKQYNSEIIHLSVANMHIVVLNTLEAAQELLERRANIYSSRPLSPVLEMIGVDNFAPFKAYGDVWRKIRKFLKEGLKKDLIPEYHDLQMERVHLLLEMLLDEPERFMEHSKMLGASVTMSMLFGYDVDLRHNEDKYLTAAEIGVEAASTLLKPGATLVAVLPFLRHIPPWFPGASAQKVGAKAREAAMLYKTGPFEYVKRNLASGTSRDCVAAKLLSNRAKSDGAYEDEEVIKDTLAGLYLAGVETMQSTKNAFFLAITLHTDAQKKAQEEIDRIVGSGRLPTFDDRPSMPYVEALYREVLRWRPVTPLGVPHASIEDDIYKGYFIPKDSVVFASAWAFGHDENMYPDADSFKPERFFKPDGTLNDDTVRYAFGFGRRICAGEYMADALLWMTIVSVLAVFDIRKAKDENGHEIPVDPNAFADDLASHALPFKCSITPRYHQSEVLIRGVASVARENLHPPMDA